MQIKNILFKQKHWWYPLLLLAFHFFSRADDISVIIGIQNDSGFPLFLSPKVVV